MSKMISVKKIASLIQRQTLFIIWMSILLTCFGGYFTFKLYGDLKTNLEELLPTSSRSVRDLNEVTRRLKSIDNLAVLVFSKDTQASKRFVIDLAEKLAAFPKDKVAGIEYRIDRELEFFRKRQALYIEKRDLIQIRDYLHARIQYETELYNPLNIFSGQEIPEPELDFRALRNKYERRTKDFAHFPGGFFATPDETKRVILINVAEKTLGIDGVRYLKQQVSQTIEKLQPRLYASDIEINYTGSVEEMLEEQEALVEDLAISTIVVILLVSASMLMFFRSPWVTAALVVSLLASTLWTFGVSYFAVGYLNANSAFLGSIVLGNGINFGIILLARYLEERRYGRSHMRACSLAISTTWKATLTAALAAGLSYGSLMLTSFRGFRQFGVIGLIGMVLCWLSTYLLLPALLSVVEKLSPLKTNKLHTEHRLFISGMIASAISRWPRMIASVSIMITVFSLFMLSHARSDLLETNLENLRSKRSIESGAAYYTLYLNEIFQRFLTPIVILPSSNSNVREIADRLKELKRREGKTSAIVSVQTIHDFIPKDQLTKINLLKEIRAILKPQILTQLSTEDRRKADALLAPEGFNPFGSNDLPPLVREKFMEKDGSLGKLVLVEPPLSKEIWQGDRLEKFIGQLRAVADSVEPGAPIAGGMAITADLISSISRDGPKATVLAFFAAVFLVIFLLRDFKTIVLVLSALFIGIIWFGGMIVKLGAYGFKINFLNFVALPITFGIGVDYGVNVFQRYRQRREGEITRVIRETGGAVALCSLTTITGYSSLLMASNQGFVSFGVLAVLGEITCVAAALIALPSLLAAFSRNKSSGISRQR